jgi:hypothetical protein
MGDELVEPAGPDPGIDLGAGTRFAEGPGDHFGGKRKGSTFGDTNPMKGNPMFDQLAVGVDMQKWSKGLPSDTSIDTTNRW